MYSPNIDITSISKEHIDNLKIIGSSKENIDNLNIIIETGRFLKEARVEKFLTGRELGELLNLSQQQISRYENGLCNITIDMLNSYLDVLDKDWSDYFHSVISNKFSIKF